MNKMKTDKIKMPLVVNLAGGPGVGKTALRAHVFAELKWLGVNCEESPEYAKGKVWEEAWNSIKNQSYILGKQHNQLFRLINKVDVIVTDAPLFNSVLYHELAGGKNKLFIKYALQEFNEYDNMNLFIKRSYKYDPNGRYQTEAQAKEVDKSVIKMFDKYKIRYEKVMGGPQGVSEIVSKIMERIKERENLK